MKAFTAMALFVIVVMANSSAGMIPPTVTANESLDIPVPNPTPVSTAIAEPLLLVDLPNNLHDMEVFTTVIETPGNHHVARPPFTTIDKAEVVNIFVFDTINPTTLATSVVEIIERRDRTFNSIAGNPRTKTKSKTTPTAIPVVTKVPVNPSAAAVIVPRETDAQYTYSQQITPATIGWIVAIIFGCLMTGCAILLLYHRLADRRKRKARRRVTEI